MFFDTAKNKPGVLNDVIYKRFTDKNVLQDKYLLHMEIVMSNIYKHNFFNDTYDCFSSFSVNNMILRSCLDNSFLEYRNRNLKD